MDNLALQIQVYDSIEDYHTKGLFIEKIIYYYEHSTYETQNKEQCLSYWRDAIRDYYDIMFEYF